MKTLKETYLYYVLKLNQEYIYKLQHGNGIPHINCYDMKDHKIPLLSLSHQKEIVEFLDKELKDIEIDKMLKELKDENTNK